MKTRIFRWSLLLVLLAGIGLAIAYREQLDAAALEQWVQSAGAAGPLLFMLIYAVGTVFFLPGSALTLAGGALFGPVLGTFYNLTGATIGAAIAFIIARYISADWVSQKAGGRMKQLVEGVEHEGWRFVAFVRLVPLFPFNLLNYALGITRIRFMQYLVASYLCMLPGAIAYTYLGYAAREAIAGQGDMQQLIRLGVIATALLAVVAYLPRIIARLRRGQVLTVEQLKQLLDNKQDIVVLDVRTADEFTGELGHIRGAANIPVNELDAHATELLEDMEQTIAIVCQTDRRSGKAAQILGKKGYADVHVVQGGMASWHKAAYPVEQ